MIKKTKHLAICAAVLLSLTSCGETAVSYNDEENSISSNTETSVSINENSHTISNVVYSDDDVKVMEKDVLSNPMLVDNIWDLPTEEQFYNECCLIAEVTVTDTKEVAISYPLMGTECTTYETLATVTVNKAYYSPDTVIDDDKEYVVAIPNTSYAYDEEFPNISSGNNYILFLKDTSVLNDSSMKISNYAEWYISSPVDVVEISGETCTANAMFDSHSTSLNTTADINFGEETYSTNSGYESSNALIDETEHLLTLDRCDMSFEDFEKSLAEKINRIGGKNNVE